MRECLKEDKNNSVIKVSVIQPCCERIQMLKAIVVVSTKSMEITTFLKVGEFLKQIVVGS